MGRWVIRGEKYGKGWSTAWAESRHGGRCGQTEGKAERGLLSGPVKRLALQARHAVAKLVRSFVGKGGGFDLLARRLSERLGQFFAGLDLEHGMMSPSDPVSTAWCNV